MKKSLFILIIAVSSAFQPLKAQFDTQLTNYWGATGYFNPGYAGSSGNLDVAALSRLQWLGVHGAPRTILVFADMPFRFFDRTHGVGVSMYNDKIGLFSANVISAQYAYKTKFLKGDWGFGVQVGYINEKFDGSKVEIPKDDDYHDPNDEAIPASDVSGTSLDASLGIYYSNKKFYAGLSVTHLLSPELELDDNYILEVPRTYYFTAGYNIQLNNPLLELRPSILVKTMELSSFFVENDTLVPVTKGNTLKGMLKQTQLDVSLRLIYKDMFWGGISWRKQDAVSLLLGGKFKMIEVGYSYDYPISRIRRDSWGSHELFLRYTVDLSKKKPIKNKHKSIRIL
jgi:type IX secretion system PorP/SprF family membrane protein